MTFNWITFLDFSKGIKQDPEKPGPREAACRSAASRAYYAAYHNARIKAESEGFSSSRSGDNHVNVQNYYLSSSENVIRKKISKELDRLRKLRILADYRDELDRAPESLADQAIGMAIRIIDDINNL